MLLATSYNASSVGNITFLSYQWYWSSWKLSNIPHLTTQMWKSWNLNSKCQPSSPFPFPCELWRRVSPASFKRRKPLQGYCFVFLMFWPTFLNVWPHCYLRYHTLTTDLPLIFQQTRSSPSMTCLPYKALLAFILRPDSSCMSLLTTSVII